jgi:cell division protein ZapA (FtsZ GTPase activity inhibitor)
MSAQTFETVQVNIFNQTYNLRSHAGGSEHVRQIARLVDERMRHISSHLTTHDVAKVAVLAALNIADELQCVRDLQAEEPDAGEGKCAPVVGSWFDDIFDPGEPTEGRGDRLSSQVSERLQELRRTRAVDGANDEGDQD